MTGKEIGSLDELGPYIVVNATTNAVLLRRFDTQFDASLCASGLNSARNALAGDFYAVLSEEGRP